MARIEDYALLGDLHTGALVATNGSIDWLCLPRFDSPACFAALLDTPKAGQWLLGPDGPHKSTRPDVEDTAVLETSNPTDSGAVRVTDRMPSGDRRADVGRTREG